MLQRKRLYLNRTESHFAQLGMKSLGHVSDDQGMRMSMDPDKPDWVYYSKMIMNWDLSRDLVGPIGELLYEVPDNHIPMGQLNSLTWNELFKFKWSGRSDDSRRQPASEEVEDLVGRMTECRRAPPSYPKAMETASLWMKTDDVVRVLVQGAVQEKAKTSVFSLAKLNNARHTYATHGVRMLASVGAISRCTNAFRELKNKWSWLLDHKCMIHLLNNISLSDHRSQRLREIILLEFCVSYVKRSQKCVVNALSSSRLYSTHSPGTDRVSNDIFYHNVMDASDETVVGTLAGDDLVTKIWVPVDIVAQVATSRGQNAMLSRPTKPYDPVVSFCFVLKYPAGRKEGGCTSQTANNDRTSKANCERVMVTTIVSHHMHRSSLAVDHTVSTEVVVTTLTSHSQPDSSIKRANRTITEALSQCIHPQALVC